MKFESIKQALQFRITENPDTYWEDDYFDTAFELFTKNIEDTIKYFKFDCTDEELYWAAELFERIAAKTQSLELIAVWRTRLAAVKPDTYNQAGFKSEYMRKWVDYKHYFTDTEEEIDFAEGQIDY